MSKGRDKRKRREKRKERNEAHKAALPSSGTPIKTENRSFAWRSGSGAGADPVLALRVESTTVQGTPNQQVTKSELSARRFEQAVAAGAAATGRKVAVDA